jgi:hypothetical protein
MAVSFTVAECAPNGGLLGTDPKFLFDPLDTRRPALDLAMPTADEVERFHLNPNVHYPDGTQCEDLRPIELAVLGTGMAGITVAALAQWRLKNVNLKIFEKNSKPVGTVGVCWGRFWTRDGAYSRPVWSFSGPLVPYRDVVLDLWLSTESGRRTAYTVV